MGKAERHTLLAGTGAPNARDAMLDCAGLQTEHSF